MRVTVWGVRGSIPTPGETTLRYGGNTPCVQIEAPPLGKGHSAHIIFDAGSGIRPLGVKLVNEIPPEEHLEIFLFLTHVHWDHIQGLPFFKPLYRANTRIHIFGPDYRNLERLIRHQMYPNYFPISLDHEDVKASLSFSPLEGPVRIGSVTVSHQYVNHGPKETAAGYRADSGGGGFVYIPDVEPATYRNGNPNELLDESHAMEKALLEFVRGAEVLLFDTTYTNEEYEKCKGWGHSPVDYALEVAARGHVRRLGLFHYDPLREDRDIDRLVEEVRKAGEGKGVSVFGSQEGMVMEIGGG